MEVKMTVSLEREEIEEAVSEYLNNRGYKTKEIIFTADWATKKVKGAQVTVQKIPEEKGEVKI